MRAPGRSRHLFTYVAQRPHLRESNTIAHFFLRYLTDVTYGTYVDFSFNRPYAASTYAAPYNLQPNLRPEIVLSAMPLAHHLPFLRGAYRFHGTYYSRPTQHQTTPTSTTSYVTYVVTSPTGPPTIHLQCFSPRTHAAHTTYAPPTPPTTTSSLNPPATIRDATHATTTRRSRRPNYTTYMMPTLLPTPVTSRLRSSRPPTSSTRPSANSRHCATLAPNHLIRECSATFQLVARPRCHG
jgi:hypothetical protein